MEKTVTCRSERARSLFREPETMDLLVEFIAEGGTLREWCRDKDVPYGMTFAWLHSDDDREEAYDTACEARKANHEDRVLDTIVGVTEIGVDEIFDEKGRLKDLAKLTRRAKQAVASVEITKNPVDNTETTRVKVHDKLRAADMLGRSRKMFTDKVEVDAQSLSALVAQSLGKPDEAK